MYLSLFDILKESVEIVRPPERLTVAEAAMRRKVYSPGAYVGPYRNELTPYMVEPQEELTSLEVTGMVFVGPARTGKSDIFFNWLLHTVICDPNDMMRVDMTQATSRDWSQGDLRRFFRHNDEVEKKLGKGRHNRNVHDLHFTNGMRLLIKWPSITELSGKTMPRLWLADYDRMQNVDDVDGEGPAFDLARKRAGTFKRYGMTVAESSPGRLVSDSKWVQKTRHEAPPTATEDNAGGILPIYNRGDRRLFYWHCPQCHTAYEPDFKHFHYPETEDIADAAAQVTLECPICAYPISHEFDEFNGKPGKFQMNLNARWVKDGLIWKPDPEAFVLEADRLLPKTGVVTGHPRRSTIASFWLKSPPAGLTDWETIVTNYLNAKRERDETNNEEPLKSCYGLDLGLPYTPKALQAVRVPETLMERKRDFGTQADPRVPRNGRFLIATIDVQKSRFVVQVHVILPQGDISIIDRFDIKHSQRTDEIGNLYWVSPGSYQEDWRLLIERVIKKDYAIADSSGRRMRIKMTLCDMHGEQGVTTQALNFWRFLRRGPQEDEKEDDSGWESGLADRFLLLRGTGKRDVQRVTLKYPDAQRKDRHSGARGDVPVLEVNSNVNKDFLDGLLDREAAHGGRIDFADWLPESFFKELCVEIRDEKMMWKNPRNERNESWDLLVYCLAATLTRTINLELIDWSDPPPWADEWDVNPLVFDPEKGRPSDDDEDDLPDLATLAEQLS